ncbi:O-antigen ligase family protein [Calothrix sp. UHCC 0171]|uniref:O-antigen ligase family protein n=1 Tax=Calothrix sp. UHCC 0171 TaxID=3110245 RepID=UPI002B2061A8|nr:O-antigen ligase family protein [Calothrix sp. UHCC 0171]MEA5573935.1 O-antigen ligase family protein [Calothrix sp. UHCC 0171]
MIVIFEKLFSLIGLLFFTGAFSQIMEGAPISLLRYFVWGIATVLLLLRWKKTIKTALTDKYLLLLTILILSSFIWSDVSILTLKDSREIIQMTVFGLYFASRFEIKEQVQIIAAAFFIGAVMSLIVVLVVPVIGIHLKDHPGAWKGVFGYKNNLGSMMIISAFTFLFLPKNENRNYSIFYQCYKWFGLALSTLLIVQSTSKTSLVISIVLLLILFFYSKYRWQGKVTVVYVDILILIFGAAATIFIGSWSEILTAIGRDPTLTGRTPMWGAALTKLMERPLFGFGRSAFWAPGSQYAKDVGLALTEGFVPPHGHNGFIDMALDVGLVGISLFAISFLISYFRALKLAYGTKEPENLWYLAFLIFLVMNNLTESFLLYKTNIYWTLYLVSAWTLARREKYIEYKI